jgi:hypothetical protein
MIHTKSNNNLNFSKILNYSIHKVQNKSTRLKLENYLQRGGGPTLGGEWGSDGGGRQVAMDRLHVEREEVEERKRGRGRRKAHTV